MSEEAKIPHIYKALDAVNKELNAIKKDQKGYGYLFRGINQALNEIGPLFKKHSIVTRKKDVQFTREFHTIETAKGPKTVSVATVKIVYAFTSLIDGSEVETIGFNEGQDSSGGDKSLSAACSNSYKYNLFEFFNISTEDQVDSDMQTAKEAVEESAFTKEKAKEVGNGFRKKVQIPKLEDNDDI